MRTMSLKCPNCGADLNVAGGREHCFCEYCGTKILLDDVDYRSEHTENVNITHRTVDEARILEAKLKQEKLARDSKKIGPWAALVKIVKILVIAFFLLIFVALFVQNVGKIGKIKTNWYLEYVGSNYRTAVAQLKAAGFTDVETIDLEADDSDPEKGKVVSVSIGGNSEFLSNDYFPRNAKVIVTYR